MQTLKIETAAGIPFANLINGKTVGGVADMVKIIYNNLTVMIFASGWPDNYHVVLEDGEALFTSYELLSTDEIKENFKINIHEYYSDADDK